jgi:hypothetical protein
VSFRDDRDAQLARAEALAREAEQLRRETEQLRREYDELREERDRLAAEQAERAREAAEQERHDDADRAARQRGLAQLARRAPTSLIAPVPVERGQLATLRVEHALAVGPLRHAWMAVVPIGVVVTGLVAGGWLASSVLGPPLALMMLIATLVGAMWVQHVMSPIAAVRERRRLERAAIPLDVDSYVAVLGGEYAQRALSIRFAFVEPPEGDDRRALEAAARAMPGATTSWAGDELIVTSPMIGTWRRSRYSPGHCDTTALHRWFRRALRRVVLPIAHVVPTTRISVE